MVLIPQVSSANREQYVCHLKVVQYIFQLVRRMSERRRDNTRSDTILDEFKGQHEISSKLQLEGQCRICQTQLLTFSLLKTCFLIIPFILSIIGLFLLKYYKTLRAQIFYWPSDKTEATHIYIKGNNKKEEQIVPLYREGDLLYFYYKKLKYEFIKERPIPIAINYQQQLKHKFGTNFLSEGLNDVQVQQRRLLYGNNFHIVDPPQYYQYLYQVMTQPFFFIQYMAAVIYIIQKLTELSILLLGSSVITTSINYILLYISYRKIKQIAEKVVEVEVIRNGRYCSMPSSELVPGDLFVPKEELYCDVLLLRGELYVNQSNLTGESIPIGKCALQQFKDLQKGDTSRWIYEGSRILSSQNALAMVIHTGYTSKRGRILRKILHRTGSVPHFFTTCIYFLAQTYIVCILIYLGTLPMRIQRNNLDPIIIFLNFMLIVTFCFPPSFPIYFNMVYSFVLMRLKWKNILGTEPQKTIESAHLKTLCFDKTGTLTEDKVEVKKILKLQKQQWRQITHSFDSQTGLDFKICGSCHTVRYFNSQLMGDEIDLKMFGASGYRLIDDKQSSNCSQVETKQGIRYNKIKIIKTFQYQSKFQSMSVLVYDNQTNKYFVFVKGAPEIIHNYSKAKYQYFDDLLQQVSYGGFRSIAYGYKEIDPQQLQKYIHENRQCYLKQITILGLLVFQNKLKVDALATINLLKESAIDSRMITGDNIYIAVETAIRCGILSRQDEIVVIEGRDQSLNLNSDQNQMQFAVKVFSFNNSKVNIVKQIMGYEQYMNSARPIVIDNNFLKLKHNLRISQKIRVFARISPENKALVIRKIKQDIHQTRSKLTKIQKILSEEVEKVGMVGDGANDLLAIKEADIGIGIRNCDSSYAASFSILNLIDIDDIVREAKCGEREIIQICRFASITGFLSVPVLIIMETEAAFYSSFQLIFGNLTKYLLFNVLLALSKPAAKPTIYKPCSNFLKLQHQLIYWGNAIIGTLAHLGIMIYFRSTPEYSWNTTRATVDSGWVDKTSLVTGQYLYYTINPVILIFAVYESSPWKQPIYKNFLLFMAFFFNVIFSNALFFLVPLIKQFLGFVDVSYSTLAYLFCICTVANIITLIFNAWISWMKFHQRQPQFCIPQKQQIELERGSSSDNRQN